MTNYAGFIYPSAELYQQELTGSLDDGLERWTGYSLFEPEMSPRQGTFTSRGTPDWPVRSNNAFIFPEWSSNLFGHILVVPSRLNLGNIISNQTRTIEIMNLFVDPHDWESLTTDVEGLTFVNPPAGLGDSPSTPYTLPAFGNYMLQVGISTEGPVQVTGDIFFGFDVIDVTVPVSGTRVVVFQFQPRPGIEETLEWKTDVLESHDGTEQRIGLRRAPRQKMRFQVILDHASDKKIRGMLFDWLPRVFSVPVWWEARRTTAPLTGGDTVVQVSTLYGDFRVDGLVMVYKSNEEFEVIGIESMDATSITLRSEVTGSYATGTKILPMRTAYSTSVPSSSRVPKEFTEYNMEFVVIENEPLPDATGQSVYDGKIYLDECNLIVAGGEDNYSRPVTILDNETGRIYQTSRTDRSRFSTKKVWDVSSLQELWRIRRLLHTIDGSRTSFFIPTFREDLVLAQSISPDSETVRVVEAGYSAFIMSRRPFADLRLTRTNGTTVTRRIIDAFQDGNEDVLTLDESFDAFNVILPTDVEKLEFVTLVRITDDKAEFTHRNLGDAMVAINLITVKE